jgi:chaperone required for assembly of F1-ATPase
MSKDFTESWFGDGEDPARLDPVRMARVGLKPQLPKRFYTGVSVEAREGRFQLLLDGRPARTKLAKPLAAETEAAGALLAAEWAAQGTRIDPATMPVTRMLHAAIDHVSGAMAEVRADIVQFAGSDVVCYRAGEPEKLVAMQAQHWDPVLAHIEARHGGRFILATSISFVDQPPESLAAIARAMAAITSPTALAAIHVLTTLAGSALIALAVTEGALTPEAGFDAGEVDADFEASVWGDDEEASVRRALRLGDFIAAANLFAAHRR